MDNDETLKGNAEVPAQGSEPVPEKVETQPDANQSTPSTGGQDNTNGVENNSTEKKTGAWRSQLPKDLRDNDAFASYETMGDFAKDALKWKEGYKAEDDSADDEQGWTDFQNREWADEDEKNMMSEFGNVLKESGIKAKDADKVILALYNSGIKIGTAQVKKQIAINDRILKDKWGDDFDDNRTVLNETAKKIYSPKDIDSMLKKGMFNDPDFCDLLVKYGKKNQDKFVKSGEKVTEETENTGYAKWPWEK